MTKALVVYDSVHGNTEQIAHAIGAAAGAAIGDDVPVLRPADVDAAVLDAADLLIVGSPTHGGRPTAPVQALLDGLSVSAIEDKRFAAFDTRVPVVWSKIFGYAAPRMARALKKRGGTVLGEPAGFGVKGTEGPLVENELERAGDWAREILKAAG